MERKYLSFELYCMEVEKIIYYNYLTDDERENVEESYIEYCEKNNLEHDFE